MLDFGLGRNAFATPSRFNRAFARIFPPAVDMPWGEDFGGRNPMRRFWAALGSLLFFVIAPGTLLIYIPHSITDWYLKPAFLGT